MVEGNKKLCGNCRPGSAHQKIYVQGGPAPGRAPSGQIEKISVHRGETLNLKKESKVDVRGILSNLKEIPGLDTGQMCMYYNFHTHQE